MDMLPSFCRRHQRHEDVRGPRDFIPHHRPTPPLLPPHRDSPLIFSSNFCFSPPRHRIVGGSDTYGFDYRRKQNFDCLLAPPSRLPPCGDFPFRIDRDCVHREARLVGEIPIQRCNDRFICDSSRNLDGNYCWGLREYNSRAYDIPRGISGWGVREFDSRVSDIEQGERCLGYWTSETEGRELFRMRSNEARRWGYDIHENREVYVDRDARGPPFGMNGDLQLYTERSNDIRRWRSAIDGELSLQLDSKREEHWKMNLGLDRCRDRFGMEVCQREFRWSKNARRVQRKSDLHKIQSGNTCRKRNRGQRISRNMNRRAFRGKGKSNFNRFKTTVKDKQEREQSPGALSISLKTNSIISKATLVPSGPTLKKDTNLLLRDRPTRKISCMDDSFSTSSCKDLIVTDNNFELHSDYLMELPEKSKAFGNENVIAYPCDFGDCVVENKAVNNLRSRCSNHVESDRRIVSRPRKKKRSRKGVLLATKLQMTNESCEIVNSNPIVASSFDVPLPKTNHTLSKVDSSCSFGDVVFDSIRLPSLGIMVSEKGYVNGDSSESFKHNSKKKRSIFKMLPTSSHMVGDANKECPGHSGRAVTTSEEDFCDYKVGTDKVKIHPTESLLTNKSTVNGAGFGINHLANNLGIYVHNGVSISIAEKNLMEPINFLSSLRTKSVDNIYEQSFHKIHLLSEKDLKVPVSVEGESIYGSLRPPETRISKVQKDEHLSEYHESCMAIVSDGELCGRIENCIVYDKTADATSKESFPNQVTIPEVGVSCLSNANGTRILEAAAANSFAMSLGTAQSDFLSADHKKAVLEFDASSLGTESDKILNRSIDTDRSPKAINNVETNLYSDYSPMIESVKARIGISGSDFDCPADRRSFTDARLENLLLKELSSCDKVDCCGDGDNPNVDFRIEVIPTEGGDSPDFGIDSADASVSGHRKKRKVLYCGSPHVENFPIGDAIIPCDCSKLGQASSRLSDGRFDQREQIHSATYMEFRDGWKNLSILGMDDMLVDGKELHEKNEDAFFSNTFSTCTAVGVCDTKSADVSRASEFDMPCMGSPENLISYSGFLRDLNSLSNHAENKVVFETPRTSNVKLVSNISSTLSNKKAVKNAASNHAQSDAKVTPILSQDDSKVVQKFSLVPGKPASSKKQLTSFVPKRFPGNPAVMLSVSKKFNCHVTKSRSWHRNCDSVPVAGPKSESYSVPYSQETKAINSQSSYIRQGNSLVRKAFSSGVIPAKCEALNSSVHHLKPCVDESKKSKELSIKVNVTSIPRTGLVTSSERPEALPIKHSGKPSNSSSCLLRNSLPLANSLETGCAMKALNASEETSESSEIPGCQIGSGNITGSQAANGKLGKNITYIKRKSNQLVAASDPEDSSTSVADKSQVSLSDGYYKKRKNQLIRVPLESHVKEGDGTVSVNSRRLKIQTKSPRTPGKRQSSRGFDKAYKSSKFSFVWKLHDAQGSNKDHNALIPKKLLPYLFPWKRSTAYRRTFRHALCTRPNSSSLSCISQKLLLSSKRGAIYTRSTHGYSLKISKVLSVGGSSLKWSKSIERNSKKANEEATRAVAAAERRRKEEKGALPVAPMSGNHVSRKSVVSVTLPPGEGIFRDGPERYKMNPTRKILQRLKVDEEPSSSDVLKAEKKSSCVPKRVFIGKDKYIRIGNGNQLVRDPKRRTRALASEKVRWSLHTARLRMARKRKYCQFFTRFGKCNKSDGKCPYIHDTSKIAVCTKFLNGSCPDPDCKLTHKVIPERMPDCSYFLKGSCSKENCPFRHVNVNLSASVCEKFLKGYCADGNECQKKHTYICPAFESTGVCPEEVVCKLHHPKRKTEKKPSGEQKIVKGRYFDGGLVDMSDCNSFTTDVHFAKGKDNIVCEEGKYPDYISLNVSEDETL